MAMRRGVGCEGAIGFCALIRFGDLCDELVCYRRIMVRTG